jgi:hypothetical protein
MNFFDNKSNPEFKIGVWANCPLLAIQADPSLGTVFFDDFFTQKSTKAASAGIWTVVEDDGASGTDAVVDTVCGIYNHYCDGDDNDEAYLATTGESWKLATGKELWFEARFTFTNSATTAGVFVIGLMEGGGGADTMQDTEAGPLADYDGFCFFKESGDSYISFETSVATAQTTTTDEMAFVSGTTYKVAAHYDGITTVTPYLDDVAGTAHTIAATGGELNACFGVKSNGAEEYIAMDYIKIVQLR